MSVLFAVALVSVVAGFLVERRLMARDMRIERRDWAVERGVLLDRIKPETSQPRLHGPDPDTFQPPVTDEAFWTANEN